MQIILLSVHPGKAGLRGGALERKRMLFVLRRGAGLLRPLQRGGRRTFRFPVLRQPVFLRRKALSRLCAALLQLCDAGFLRRELLCELSRLLCFVNNPSPAFVIRALGGALFSSLPLGRRIYFCVVLSSAMAGLLSRFLFPLFSPSTAPEALTQSTQKTAPAAAHFPLSASAPASSVFVSLSGALTRSAGAMLNVCASVVFFSAFGECLLTMGRQIMAWRPFQRPDWITVLVSGFIEISGGCASAALLSDRELGALCACAICSFSGMAVFMQICTTCQAVPGVSFRPYWVSKIFQACLSPSLLILWLRLQPLEIPPVAALPTGSGFLPSPERIFAIAISAFFCLCLLVTHRAKPSP